MDERLQAAAVQLATIVVKNKLSNSISYEAYIGNGYLECLDFAIYMWDTDKSKIIKHRSYRFKARDTDLAIARKMVEITNIINGKIDPFEEAKNDNNKQA